MSKKELPDYVIKANLEAKLGEDGILMMKKKYIPQDREGHLIQTPEERFYTVANEVAKIEEQYGANPEGVTNLTREFFDIMTNLDFLPGGRILANAGTQIQALANCYVLPVEDDLDKIYQAVNEAALIHKSGGGTGYNFSKLRPRGARVKHGVASGPVSFAGQFDKETEIINSGNRRGANMGILNIDHPDIFGFISAKFEEGKLINFNVSVGITNDFMEAVNKEGYYPLQFNDKLIDAEFLEQIKTNIETGKAGAEVGRKPIPPSLIVKNKEVYHQSPKVDADKRIFYDTEGNVKTKEELVGKVSENGGVLINAKKTLEIIAKYAHASGEPGLIFLDNIEKYNLLKSDGKMDTTNPCGEQPLHPYGACDLGSINLSNMFFNTKVDYKKLEKITRLSVRFLDNVNDLSQGPIKKIEKKMKEHRRIGLGVMGWADMLMKLKIPYDSPKAIELAESVMGNINDWAMDESIKLAKEKGAFPKFDESDYPKDKPVRNLARTTIAPTGSISMVAGVNGGIEPYYSLSYFKQMRGGDKVLTINPLFEKAIKDIGLPLEEIIQKVKEHDGSCQNLEEIPRELRDAFKTAHDLKPESHLNMQAAFQRHLDNAISKTINLPTEATIEDVVEIYKKAHELGCKGVTVYRNGSRSVQVLENVKVEKGRPDVIGTTVEQTTPHGNAFITLNVIKNEPSVPYECFINIGRGKKDIGAISEGFGRLLSLSFKEGIKLEKILDQIKGIPGETQIGIGKNNICSLPDAIAIGLADAYKQINEQQNSPCDKKEDKTEKFSGNFCSECGAPLIKVEGCSKCSNLQCGYSKC